MREHVCAEEKAFLFAGKPLPCLYLEFLAYQRDVKGLSTGSIHNLKKPVLCFLLKNPQFGKKSGIVRLRAKQIQDYATRALPELSREQKRRLVTGLREYLRFLHVRGYLREDLSFCVPTVTTYRLTTFHRGIPWDKVESLLRVPDRKTHVGRRDYAILLMLALYGVRQGQLIHLELKDIDWKEQTIHFAAVKGGRDILVPLFPQMAEALIEYFKGGRKNAAEEYQQVFLKSGRGGSAAEGQRPLGRALWYMIHRHMRKIGITEASELPRGTHAIRHAFAQRLIDRNEPMKTIADLLGHRSIQTTFVYAKSDLTKLRCLALEWPESRKRRRAA
jgi:integrase/recombinase XerD